LQLQTAAVIWVHHQHGFLHEFVLERHRFLARADGLDDHVIKIGARQKLETCAGRGRQPTRLPARRHTAHENAVVLRVDHRGAVA